MSVPKAREQADYTALRKQFARFVYRHAVWRVAKNGLELSFEYQIQGNSKDDLDISFTHRIDLLGVTQTELTRLSTPQLDWFIFQIGLIEMLSYWKLTASPQIVVQAGVLDADQIAWWRQLLLAGMGEYFYQNQLDFTVPDFVQITAGAHDVAGKEPNSLAQHIATDAEGEKLADSTPSNIESSTARVLIPLGGGKDSVVSLELLKSTLPAQQLGIFLVSPAQAALDIAKLSGLKNIIRVERHLDPHLLKLNQQGFLNGHVPVSATFAWLSLLSAALFDFDLIAVSNERSSNEGNVEYLGYTINHQYSKTFAFEQSFQEYVARYFPQPSNAPFYFSLMRPLYELQIGERFAQLADYHPVFRSCNRGQKTNSWCCDCPKCLFAYIILYPFLGESKTRAIFGQNLLTKPSLIPLAEELIGRRTEKPFECVGTHEESLVAFYLTLKKWQVENKVTLNDEKSEEIQEKVAVVNMPAVLAHLAQILKSETDLEQRAKNILEAWNEAHAVPRWLLKSFGSP